MLRGQHSSEPHICINWTTLTSSVQEGRETSSVAKFTSCLRLLGLSLGHSENNFKEKGTKIGGQRRDRERKCKKAEEKILFT